VRWQQRKYGLHLLFVLFWFSIGFVKSGCSKIMNCSFFKISFTAAIELRYEHPLLVKSILRIFWQIKSLTLIGTFLIL
jgi:hypothetical protein